MTNKKNIKDHKITKQARWERKEGGQMAKANSNVSFKRQDANANS